MISVNLLKSGRLVPKVGIGTWKLEGEECYNAVKNALEVGYRHIDTADSYRNHSEVRKAIRETKIPRADIFLTTKLKHDRLTSNYVLEDSKRFLEELGTDYIDLLMIHWPNKLVPIEETLGAMNELKKKGLIRFIGVSNFTIHHLKDAISLSEIHSAQIDFNQVEYHPTLNQKDLYKFCNSKGIIVEAYSPLGMGEELELPTVKALSEKYIKTPSQIILNWLLWKDLIVIPKSRSKDHLKENLDSVGFKMSNYDYGLMESLNTNNRLLRKDIDEFDY